MYLGIEIGGTKLQIGVGDGSAPRLAVMERRTIDRDAGAKGILAQIHEVAKPLILRHHPKRIGIGFGGPVDQQNGVVRISHQVEGWEQFPLANWCQDELGVPARLGNDCDVAALAEFRFGAGSGANDVFYVTVGTGVGGGCVLGGKLLGGGRPAIAEIGHLRPGVFCTNPHATVESEAAGPGIAEFARQVLDFADQQVLPCSYQTSAGRSFHLYDADVTDLRQRAGGPFAEVSALILGQAATAGNALAKDLLDRPIRTLGWAIAQVITLTAPEVVVVGGGVSLLGEQLFFAPLAECVKEYVFPPLAGSYRIVPAALGEETVVHGAVALAAIEN